MFSMTQYEDKQTMLRVPLDAIAKEVVVKLLGIHQKWLLSCWEYTRSGR